MSLIEADSTRHIVPIERQSLSTSVDGSTGRFRCPPGTPALISASSDIEAIHAWLANVRSDQTRRAYRKEAERLLAWAIVERGKALSSLDLEDMVAYERFLKNPVSERSGVSWVASQKPGEKKRHRRDSPLWRPFDGPLSQSSLEYAITVLKGMFSFFSEVGYTMINPLKIRKKSYSPDPTRVLDRALSPKTWAYLYQYLERGLEVDESLSPSQRMRQLRVAYQRIMIFTVLYLLGLRISELSNLKMFHFKQRFSGTQDGWWVTILGKGNKERIIPVPLDLMKVLSDYRRFLNTFPHPTREKAQLEYGCAPSADDDSSIILSSTGLAPISANRVHGLIKEALSEMADALTDVPCDDVNVDAIKSASAHWMRHTSATHQGLNGVSLRHRKDALGHASMDTTLIYDHINNEEWVREVKGFQLSK